MGAINYGTSYSMYNKGKRARDKDITIGLKPMSDYSDEESGYKEYITSIEETEDSYSRDDYDHNADENSYQIVKDFLENCDMPEHYTINIEPGYYEGFYLKIEDDIPCYLTSEEQKEYHKDIVYLKELLLQFINEFGLKVIHPGWCTKYCNEEDSLKELDDFIKNLKQEIKDIEIIE